MHQMSLPILHSGIQCTQNDCIRIQAALNDIVADRIRSVFLVRIPLIRIVGARLGIGHFSIKAICLVFLKIQSVSD